jgi:serine/threonine-protein kinase RsbW
VLATFELGLVIGSRFENLELVDILVDAVAGHLELDEREAIDTALAVREAAVNAIQHCGDEAEDRPVRISVVVEDGELSVEVADSGPGFDPAAVKDPLAPENILKPCGRGIFLMRSYMDDVDFRFPRAGGTVVTLRRRLGRRPRRSRSRG